MTTLSGIITPTNIVTASSTETLTNKTINGSNNSLSNVDLTTAITGTLPVANGGTGATSLTSNNVLLGNGTSAVQAVAPGTSGNVLTSNGTTWQSTAPAGGGAWEYISTTTASNDATITLTTPTGYDVLRIVFLNIQSSGSDAGFYIDEVYHNGVAKPITVTKHIISGNSQNSVTGESDTSSPFLLVQTGTASSEYGASGTMDFFNPRNSSVQSLVHFNFSSMRNEREAQQTSGTFYIDSLTQSPDILTGIRFQAFSPATIESGQFIWYGLNTS